MPFSYSQLSLYRTCPRQYEFASVKKIPRQISAGESFGSSVHNTLKKWGELELRHNDHLQSTGDQLQLFASESVGHDPLTVETLLELWHSSFITEGYASKADADAARAKGEKVMQHFFEWWSASSRNVLAIEKGFKWESPGNFTVSGRFDRVEQAADGVRIIDFKTSAPREQKSVDEDLQLSIYALAAQEAFNQPCTELLLLFLREDGVTEVHTTRSPDQLAQATQEMDSLVEGIDSEEFAPTPSQTICSRCPYRGICDVAAV